jgi:hypothetical protein
MSPSQLLTITFVALIADMGTARADLVSNITLGGFGVPPPVCTYVNGSTSCNVNGYVTSTGFPFNPLLVAGTASAAAQYGSLSANLNLISTPFGGIFNWAIEQSAEFTDTLTVGDYSGSGYIQFEVTSTAGPSYFNAGIAENNVQLDVDGVPGFYPYFGNYLLDRLARRVHN